VKKLILSLLILLYAIINCSYAQNQQAFKGVVIDSLENISIPNVSIYLKNNNNGTISNATGEFELKFKNNKPDTIVISHISYKTKKIPFNPSKNQLNIYLCKRTVVLPEVNISEEDYVKGIVRKAYGNIKNNFRIKEAIIGATYNEQLIETINNTTKAREIKSGIFIEDPGYEKTDYAINKENVFIENIEKTKDELEMTKMPASKTWNKLDGLFPQNPLRYKSNNDIWDTDNKKYNYTLERIIKKDTGNENIFVINFESKPEITAYKKGTLYITQNTYNIEEISIVDFDENTKNGLFLTNLNDSTYSQTGCYGKYTISFRNTSYGKDIAYIESESAIKFLCNNKTTYCFLTRLRLEYNEYYSEAEMKNIDVSKLKPMKDMFKQSK